MQETVVSTGTNVKFIGSATPMTQANWQDYFSTTMKNGVVGMTDFLVDPGYESNVKINDGKLIVNGLIIKQESVNGYIFVPKPASGDALYCVRVYLTEQKYEIIRKDSIAEGTSYQDCADVIVDLIQSEDAYCERNEQYFDFAIGYYNANVDTTHIVDCRRYSETLELYENSVTWLRGKCYNTNTGSVTLMLSPFWPVEKVKFVSFYSGSTIGFSKYFFLATGTAYNANVAPLVAADIPITFEYNNAQFTNGETAITHTTTTNMASFEVSRTATSYIQYYIITVQD